VGISGSKKGGGNNLGQHKYFSICSQIVCGSGWGLRVEGGWKTIFGSNTFILLSRPGKLSSDVRRSVHLSPVYGKGIPCRQGRTVRRSCREVIHRCAQRASQYRTNRCTRVQVNYYRDRPPQSCGSTFRRRWYGNRRFLVVRLGSFVGRVVLPNSVDAEAPSFRRLVRLYLCRLPSDQWRPQLRLQQQIATLQSQPQQPRRKEIEQTRRRLMSDRQISEVGRLVAVNHIIHSRAKRDRAAVVCLSTPSSHIDVDEQTHTRPLSLSLGGPSIWTDILPSSWRIDERQIVDL